MNTKDIPPILTALEDSICKELDDRSVKKFSTQFIEAIPIGADLSGVYNKWAIRLLKRVKVYASDDGRIAIDKIIGILEKKVDSKEIEAAINTACVADCESAWVAAQVAVQVTTEKDDTDCVYTVVNATSDIVANAAAINERKKQRDDLLELLREMKI